MAKLPVEPLPARPEHCFVKELPGENPPSFSALVDLYELATRLFELRPWKLLHEGELTLVRNSASGDICYCSVMGSLGEVIAMHAYIGQESFRLYHRIAAEELADPGEFFATQRSVYVEFVPRKDLERQDRDLLAWLGHPQTRGMASPIFRAIRPGFFPWFVNAEEAQILAECIQATIVVSTAVVEHETADFWDGADRYPMVSRVEGQQRRYQIDVVEAKVPDEPPVVPVQFATDMLAQVRRKDYPVRGVMELDYIFSGTPIGKKNERMASSCVALAVDAASGFLYSPEVTQSNAEAGEALAKVFLKAVQANRALPREVRVRTQRLKNAIAPLMESFGVEVRSSSKLFAADEARSALIGFLGEER
jgi:hypothetical protein